MKRIFEQIEAHALSLVVVGVLLSGLSIFGPQISQQWDSIKYRRMAENGYHGTLGRMRLLAISNALAEGRKEYHFEFLGPLPPSGR